MKIVLQKAIALSGFCSRRKAEILIENNEIKINGQIAKKGDKVYLKKDKIEIRGKKLSSQPEAIYLMLNKPRGYTCTNRRFPNEKNIFDLLPNKERLFAVGRLDKDSRGLVLLTNDGDLAFKLSHPSFEHKKEYQVKLKEKIEKPKLISEKFIKGIDIGEGDGLVKAVKVEYLQNNTFIITLSEGKKRQIRRMFNYFKLTILDLKRISLAGISLGNLEEGKWRNLNKKEIEYLINK